MPNRVAIVGMSGITAFGDSWEKVSAGLKSCTNAVEYMEDWNEYSGLLTKLAAPVKDFSLPNYYTRKKIRSMSRLSLFSTRATEQALTEAGLIDDEILHNGQTGVAFGSSAGGVDAIASFGSLLVRKTTEDITSTTYVKMMPHTTAVNVGLFFGIRGRVIPTSSACTSGSQAIGYAYESIRDGYQTVMVAGGAEELTAADAAVFDTLFATSQKNATPKLTPSPFDKKRDGLVIGEGSGAVILEEYEHAKARGANILGEIVGFSTNCDATHITQPNRETIEICIRNSLSQAHIPPSEVGYICAHGTATTRGDIAEGQATYAVFGNKTPISSLKSYFGHTLGACGATEAWMSLMMMREGWFAPTINLNEPDPECGELDFIMHEPRKVDTQYIQTNNFAFGGVNTSLVIKRGD
ncbi:MAG TPA: beta-ketoacyl-ACP synthase [Succinivibrionaceae bacterium]|nr:beta-ketoacyl-ACP synthase [Succinivibrionaceae bacterium]